LSFSARVQELPTQERPIAEDDPSHDDAGLTFDDGFPADAAPDDAPAAGPVRGPRPARRVAAWVTTALAVALLMFALLAPDDLSLTTFGSFARIPLEALLGVVLVLLLPWTAGRAVVLVGGLALGLLTIVKIIDTVTYAVLGRPFNLVLDWVFVGEGLEFVTASSGRTAATALVVAVGLLAVGIPLLTALAALRLSRLVSGHHTAATAAVAVLGIVWVTAAQFGVNAVPGEPLASRSATLLASDRATKVRASLRDRQVFERVAAVDAFRNTPGDQLLTGLRGKDVVLTYVESYGRSALEHPDLAPYVTETLDAGTHRLNAAGYSSRSGFLTSPTAGGGSKLAHATLLSGLWVDDRQRYKTLTTSDRMTLTHAFQRAGWNAVAVAPGVTRTWAEGTYFGYDKIYTANDLGYRGPAFNWATMTDQYVLSAFERLVHSKREGGPVMTEIPLVSSHLPWAPVPELIDWEDVGDGSVYHAMQAAGNRPQDVWQDSDRIRTEYRRAVEYSLNTLISYVEKYGDEDLVLVFLGDHQPVDLVTGKRAGNDVPITVVAKDPAVLEQISGWGWTEGLRPAPTAPVWKMNEFRDRFLGTFGSRPSATGAPGTGMAR
jgi:hypothetical protein